MLAIVMTGQRTRELLHRRRPPRQDRPGESLGVSCIESAFMSLGSAKAARARTPARSCPFACVPRTVVPPPVHVDVRMRARAWTITMLHGLGNSIIFAFNSMRPGAWLWVERVWVTGPVIPVNLLCVSPTRLPGDVARWLRGMWLRGMNEFALKCEESDL